jgi:hypothetical protein
MEAAIKAASSNFKTSNATLRERRIPSKGNYRQGLQTATLRPALNRQHSRFAFLLQTVPLPVTTLQDESIAGAIRMLAKFEKPCVTLSLRCCPSHESNTATSGPGGPEWSGIVCFRTSQHFHRDELKL